MNQFTQKFSSLTRGRFLVSLGLLMLGAAIVGSLAGMNVSVVGVAHADQSDVIVQANANASTTTDTDVDIAISSSTSAFTASSSVDVTADASSSASATVSVVVVDHDQSGSKGDCKKNPQADLSVTKTVDNASPNQGDMVHYTITVSALGPATSTSVIATDTLPSGITFSSVSSSIGTYSSSTGTWTIGDMSASSTATLTVAATVNASSGTKIVNTATAGESASSTDPNTGNNRASVTINVATSTPAPATVIATKIICPAAASLPDLGGSGQTITSSTASAFLAAHPECHLASGWDFQWGYSTATNPGNNLIGEAPSSTGWHTFGPTGSNGQASVLISDLQSTPNLWVREVSQAGYLGFSYPANSTTSPEMFCGRDVENYDNYDRVDGPVAGGTYYCVAWNVPLATSTPVAALSVTKTVDNASPNQGDMVHYTVTVSANGPATSTDVIATDTLPSGITFVSATATLGLYASSTGTWTIGDMSASSSATLTIAATVNASSGTAITNTASVGESASSSNPNAGNDNASTTLTVATPGGGGGGGPTTGTVNVMVLVSNTHGGTATSSDFTVTVAGGNPNPSLFPGNASGTSVTVDANATYAVSVNALPNYEATSSPACSGTVAAGGNASCTITVNDIASAGNAAGLTVTKTVDNAYPIAGDTVTYTVTVSAFGPATSTIVSVHDILPTGLSIISATTSDAIPYDMTSGDWVIGTLSPNATATLVMTTAIDSRVTGPLLNTATVSELSSLINPDEANNSSTVAINVQAPTSTTPVCTSNCGGGGGGGGVVISGGGGGSAYSLAINGGAPQTATTSVMLSLYGTGAFTMEIANTSDFASSTWEPYATTQPWILTPSLGEKTVYAKFRALAGNILATVPASIQLVQPQMGQVLGASTSTGQVLGASTSCGIYLRSYIKQGANNDPTEVKKLQTFLNQNLGADLPVTGYYGPLTYAAVEQFQVKYHPTVLQPWVPYGLTSDTTPTGYVYKTTQRWINELMCSQLNLALPALP